VQVDDALPHREVGDVVGELDDGARELVPWDHRALDEGKPAATLDDVAVADAFGLDSHDRATRSQRRARVIVIEREHVGRSWLAQHDRSHARQSTSAPRWMPTRDCTTRAEPHVIVRSGAAPRSVVK
jgi:hypothetical protein